MKNFRILALICGFALLLPAVAQAHHSAAGYDTQKRVAIKGTIKKVSFRNPHGHIELMVDGKPIEAAVFLKDGMPSVAGGKEVEWEVETAAANLLRRRGWDFRAVKKGQTVTLIGHPSKDKKPIMYLREIHFEDGTVFGDPDGADKALD